MLLLQKVCCLKTKVFGGANRAGIAGGRAALVYRGSVDGFVRTLFVTMQWSGEFGLGVGNLHGCAESE